MKRIVRWMSLHTLTLAVTAPMMASPAMAAETKWVEFDSFVYEGKDKIFDAAPPEEGTFYNPVLAGFCPDPSICRVGRDYYLVNSSFSFYPVVPIYHSTDLVNWTQLGHVLDRPPQLDLDGLPVSSGIFAPAITNHDGLFYMITTNVRGIGNFFVTAKDPAGPWSDPVKLDFDGIDPSIFFDDDGRAYIDPILTQRDLDPKRPNPVTALGHADLVETTAGEW